MAPPKQPDPKQPVTCRIEQSVIDDYMTLPDGKNRYRQHMEQVIRDNAPSASRVEVGSGGGAKPLTVKGGAAKAAPKAKEPGRINKFDAAPRFGNKIKGS